MGRILRFSLAAIASAIFSGAALAMLAEPFWQELYKRLGIDSSKWVGPMIDLFSKEWVHLVFSGIFGSAIGAWAHWMASKFDNMRAPTAQSSPNHASRKVETADDVAASDDTKSHWRADIGGDVANLSGVSVVANAESIFVASTDKREGNGASDGVRVDDFRLSGDPNTAFGRASGYSTFRLNGFRSNVARMSLLSDGSVLVAGTAYDDPTGQSSAFMATVNSDGSLGSTFPGGIFSTRLASGKLTYGWDALQIGDNFYLTASVFGSPFLNLIKIPAESPATFEVFSISINTDGTIWPKIARRAFPEDAIYIAGRIISSDSATSDGFVAKVKPNGALDQSFGGSGWVGIQNAFGLELVHNIVGLEVLADGTVIIAGTGSNGFAVALDAQGAPKRSFGNNGIVRPRGLYSMELSSMAISESQRIVTLGGTESDGNSISRPFLFVLDMNARTKAVVRSGIVYVETSDKAQMRDHVILPEGRCVSLIHEGDFLRQSARVALVGQTLP